MLVEALVGLADHTAVESLLGNSRFVSTNQENSRPCRIKSKRYPPHSAICMKPEFFHIRMLRAL